MQPSKSSAEYDRYAHHCVKCDKPRREDQRTQTRSSTGHKLIWCETVAVWFWRISDGSCRCDWNTRISLRHIHCDWRRAFRHVTLRFGIEVAEIQRRKILRPGSCRNNRLLESFFAFDAGAVVCGESSVRLVGLPIGRICQAACGYPVEVSATFDPDL